MKILHLVQEAAGRTVAELCAATGLHANTVREHLQRLIDGGYVVSETERRTTRGRPRVLYSAATGTTSALSPIAERRAHDAARRGDLMRKVMPWTDSAELPTDALHQIDALVDDLGAAGFEPAVDEDSLTVNLSPCPHAGTNPAHRDTLCTVHVALMDGVMSQAGGPLRVQGIAPSCDPTACVVHLTAR